MVQLIKKYIKQTAARQWCLTQFDEQVGVENLHGISICTVGICHIPGAPGYITLPSVVLKIFRLAPCLALLGIKPSVKKFHYAILKSLSAIA